MNKEEICDEWRAILDSFHNDIKSYKDWLNCMKGFLGNDFPMTQRFESMVDRLKHNGELHMQHIAQFYNKNINDIKSLLETHYPCTIVCDRYSGSYSGGIWTAWPMYHWEIPQEIEGSDPECMKFWNEYDKSFVGIGNTPDSAMMDLELKLSKKILDEEEH